ncbi:uncharacterized protein TNCV_3653901 [Trichonephila clavipes]|nr:uncharacterized protein TNCV_3653901 [Trichonephila clavipes]
MSVERLTVSLVDLRGGEEARKAKVKFAFMDPNQLCPGKGLVLPNLNNDDVAKYSRFLILSLPNNEMSRKFPFVVHKALTGIGGEPKSIKKLRSGDLLIETTSALQSKSFFLDKTFFDFSLTVNPHTDL